MPIIKTERTVDGWVVTTKLPDYSASFVYTKLDGGQWLFKGKQLDSVTWHHQEISTRLEEAIQNDN